MCEILLYQNPRMQNKQNAVSVQMCIQLNCVYTISIVSHIWYQGIMDCRDLFDYWMYNDNMEFQQMEKLSYVLLQHLRIVNKQYFVIYEKHNSEVKKIICWVNTL